MIPSATQVGHADAPRVVWFLHGILGSGANWRGFARRLTERHPDWRAVLVDLRNHGSSTGARPPHDLAACAGDLWELSAARDEQPHVVVGHSFGGKVALTFAQQALHLGAVGEGGLEQVWVLDATPGAWPGDADDDAEVLAVMAALRTVPVPLDKREQVVTHLTAAGFSDSLARWMTTNLRATPAGYVWKFDLDAAREMIADYFQADLWPLLEAPGDLRIDVVRAERSDRWTQEEQARFDATPDSVHCHTLRDSGHWVHVDNPEGLSELLDETFGERA